VLLGILAAALLAGGGAAGFGPLARATLNPTATPVPVRTLQPYQELTVLGTKTELDSQNSNDTLVEIQVRWQPYPTTKGGTLTLIADPAFGLHGPISPASAGSASPALTLPLTNTGQTGWVTFEVPGGATAAALTAAAADGTVISKLPVQW